MNSGLGLATGAGIGAALMYLLDPDRGNQRRAIMRDQFIHAANETGETIGTVARDMRHRARGVMAEASSTMSGGAISDDIIRERVRADMGRVVSHPSSIIATVRDGDVILSGPILEDEVDPLIACVRAVRGVRSVQNRLDVHATANGIPGLQGGQSRRRGGLLRDRWTPTARVLVGATGGALTLYGLRREDTTGAVLGLVGMSLLTRASTNLGVRRITGVGAGRRGLTIQKAININAPLSTVFAFWKDYRHFPHFMSHVREVRETSPGRSHWVVDGPAGVPVEWDAIITEEIPNELIAWESVEDSEVQQAGTVRFQQLADGGTHVDIKLSYNPPAGAIGHAVATFFGANPGQEMTDDLMRVKTMLETGNPPSDAAQPVPQVTVKPVGAGPATP